MLLGEAHCRCGIEDHVIDGRMNPESIEAFCAGDYKACPTWQLEKERVAENKKANSYLDESRFAARKVKARKTEHAAERYKRAYDLLFGDTAEARRFRERTNIRKRIGDKGMETIAERAA